MVLRMFLFWARLVIAASVTQTAIASTPVCGGISINLVPHYASGDYLHPGDTVSYTAQIMLPWDCVQVVDRVIMPDGAAAEFEYDSIEACEQYSYRSPHYMIRREDLRMPSGAFTIEADVSGLRLPWQMPFSSMYPYESYARVGNTTELFDIVQAILEWGHSGTLYADANGDGTVGIDDLVHIITHLSGP